MSLYSGEAGAGGSHQGRQGPKGKGGQVEGCEGDGGQGEDGGGTRETQTQRSGKGKAEKQRFYNENQRQFYHVSGRDEIFLSPSVSQKVLSVEN